MKRKLLAILLSVTMVVTLTPAISFADTETPAAADPQTVSDSEVTVIMSGSCGATGSNVSYVLTSDGTLTITGEGKMACKYDDDGWNHDSCDYYTPWYEKRSLIKKVVIGKGITNIGTEAFNGLENSEECVYEGSLEDWCKITFGSNTSNPCRYGAALIINNEEVKDLVIPDSITRIGDFAFSGCGSITSVTIPNTVTKIGKMAFPGTKITEITIPGSVETIEHAAFFSCPNLKNITISDGVETIVGYAFKECSSLKNVYIPNSVGSIGEFSFFKCTSLKNVYIPTSVGSIGDRAFFGCDNCTAWCAKPEGLSLNCNVVKGASISDYNFYASLTGEESNIVIPEGMTVIPNRAFKDYSNLKTVTIPNSVTSIGSAAFNGCANLNYVLYGGNNKENLNIANGNEVLDSATWYYNYSKTALDEAIANAKSELAEYKNLADYRDAQKAELQTAIATESENLDAVIAKELLPAALASAKAELDKIKTDAQLTQEELAAAKESAKTELSSYKESEDYRSAEQEELAGAIAAGNEAIDAAENTDDVSTALADAKVAIDKIKTDAQLSLAESKATAKKELSSYKDPADYRPAEREELANAIAAGNEAIDAAENTDDVSTALASAKAELDKIKTDAQLTQEELAAAKESAKAELQEYKNSDNYKEAQKEEITNAIEAGNEAIDAAENIDAVNQALADAKLELDKIKTSRYYQIYSATLSTTTYTYNGKSKKPSVTVKNSEGDVLNAETDYDVKYDSGRTNVGTYEVTITGKGNFSGTVTKYFKVFPKTTTQYTPSRASRAFTAKWKKASSKYASGYQVMYSTKSSMSGAKTITVSGYSRSSLKISKLSKNKKYYVQVRTYKTVGGTKYYSAWSNKKSVKTK